MFNQLSDLFLIVWFFLVPFLCIHPCKVTLVSTNFLVTDKTQDENGYLASHI